MKAATDALLRFFAASLAFGYVQLAETLARQAILFSVPPGGEPPIALYSQLDSGGTWMVLFGAIATVGVFLKGLLLIVALRLRKLPLEGPWLVSLAGLGGLLATGASLVLNTVGFMWLARQLDSEQIAASSIASAVSSNLSFGLDWLVSLSILVALLVSWLQGAAPEPREGPYREPAA